VRVLPRRGVHGHVVTATAEGEPHAAAHPEPDRSIDAVELPWVPSTVVDACSVCLHRLDAGNATSLGITSSLRREGRTTVALGAAAVQRNEYRRATLLLELDLEQPTLAEALDAAPTPGVSEFLRGAASLAEIVQWVGPDVGVVVAGEVGGEAVSLLSRFHRSRLLAGLAGMTDVVVGDLPPLVSAGLGERVVGDFGQALLVVRAGRTPMSIIQSAVGRFEHPPPVLLNEKTSRIPRWLRPAHGG